MNLCERKHGAASEIKLAHSNIADLQPVIGRSGLHRQLAAGDIEFAIGVIADRDKSKSGIAAGADRHLPKSALANISDVVGGDKLAASDSDRARGSNAVADGYGRGRLE